MRESPNDIFNQVYPGSSIEDGKEVVVSTKSGSPMLDEGVKSVEERLMTWQERVNDWRKKIIQNEQVITLICVLSGMVYSYAINECTGDLDIAWYVYLMASVIVALGSLLVISEGGLLLIVLVKFGLAMSIGHYAVMWLVAVDGHYWAAFTYETCRYPMTPDLISGFIVGVGSGFTLAKFRVTEAK